MSARLDHLVVAAVSLEQGMAWCRDALGVEPGPGGKHPLMGTHNRLLRIATVDHPQAYLEIIAVDPEATPQRKPPARRWFDLDNPRLREQLARQGPQIVHWVARVPQLDVAQQALRRLDIDSGTPLEASRETPKGLLRWRIAVREDGQRLFDGCLPTLIEWNGQHPSSGMSESGVTLQTLTLSHPQAARLGAACDALELHGIGITEGPARLVATLMTPRGRVRLESNEESA